MTKAHHTQALPLPKTKTHQRQLKIRQAYHSYQLNQNHPTPVGEIHLKGQQQRREATKKVDNTA